MARRLFNDNTPFEDCYDSLGYTVDALGLAADDGDKEVGALHVRIDPVLGKWEPLSSQRRSARRGVGRANALVKRRDFQADGRVVEIHNDVLGHVRQDKKHPLFVRFFPISLNTIVRKGLGTELTDLRTIQLKLAEKETPAAIAKEHGKPLAQVIDQAEAALKAREQAGSAQSAVVARIAAWRDEANNALLGVEGALKQIASERRLGTDWVDSFFPPPEPKKPKSTAPATDGTQTKSGPAPATESNAPLGSSAPASPEPSAPH